MISVGSSAYALQLQRWCNNNAPLPTISRNVITNPQGSGISVDNGVSGLTIDANTVSVRLTGIQVDYSGGVVAITNNTLESTNL